MIDKGLQPPAVYYDQPEIPIGYLFYWNAFSELSSERQIGMGIGPIPRSKIREFAAEYGLCSDAEEFFYNVIRAMDTEYISSVSGSKKDGDKKEYNVPVDDVQGVRKLMDYFATRAKNATVKHKKKMH